MDGGSGEVWRSLFLDGEEGVKDVSIYQKSLSVFVRIHRKHHLLEKQSYKYHEIYSLIQSDECSTYSGCPKHCAFTALKK